MFITKKSYLMTDSNDLHIKDKDYFFIDENSDMGIMYLKHFPYVEFEHENGIVTKITPLESENKPQEPTENEILRDYILELDYKIIMMELGI